MKLLPAIEDIRSFGEEEEPFHPPVIDDNELPSLASAARTGGVSQWITNNQVAIPQNYSQISKRRLPEESILKKQLGF